MTRNQNIDCKEHTAKVIFKNSLNTLHTYSKTYSGASQIFTKSLLLQLKQNLPKDNYYEDNGTVKRDLSIETDICILRRYCKKKRNKLLNREIVSAKSKYSINRTEIDTIDEFQHDTSACGDSEQNVQLPKTCFNINLTSLVIDNLKDLLSDWIKTYLLEKKETKQKIDSVLDSILHKLDLQRNDHDTSSSYTYTVDVEVVNPNRYQKTELKSNLSKDFTLQNANLLEETSNLSIPLNGKYLRIISTLSLPRNTHKIKRRRTSRHNMKRIRHKKILLSTSKSSNYIFKSSKLDFLTLPTKSLTKHCVTYEYDETKELKAKNIIPQSLSSTKELIDDLIHNENIRDPVRKIKLNKPLSDSKKIKNFIKCVYSDDSQITQSNSKSDQYEIHVDSINKNKIQELKSSNEQEQSDPLISIDLVSQSFEYHNTNKQQTNNVLKLKSPDRIHNNKDKYRRNNKCKKKLSKYHNNTNIKTKQFTYLFRKSNNLINQEKTLLKHFQSIFRYFSSWEGKKDIKVDIQVNVFPSGNKEGDSINSEKNQFTKTIQPDVLTCTDNQKLDNNVTTENVTSYDKPNIISLLDGAASQAKYIISRETSTDTSETNNKIDSEKSNLNIKHSKIAQEINELKIIIKSLATATEKIANDHLQRKQNILKQTCSQPLDKYNTTEPNKAIDPNKMKSSKCIQFSSITPRSAITSGIKIKKEPRSRNGKNYNPQLIKKSTSYKIIESESILKVTDMTSAAQDIAETVVDEALTCSLPKSKSLFEVSMGPDKNKLLAFYCDDFVKPDDNLCNNCAHEIPYCSHSCNNGCHRVKPFCVYSKCNINRCCNSEICPEEPDFVCTEFTPTTEDYELCDDSSSSVCIDIDSKSFEKKISIKNRNGMGFWEGCLYCILLWIPLILISWLFYIHVIKDLVKPKQSLLRMLSISKHDNTNTSLTDIPISLSDLGFY